MSADYPVFSSITRTFRAIVVLRADYARSSWRRTMYRFAKAHVTTIA